MLPVSSWPPGSPGASLSPFGKPREIRVSDHLHGFVIPKGAWIVVTGSNSVIMFRPPVETFNPARSPGTGLLPGSIPATRPPRQPCPPFPPPSGGRFWTGPGQVSINQAGTATVSLSLSQPTSPCPTPPVPPCPAPSPPPGPRRFPKHNTVLEAWRAWQRKTGDTEPPILPLPGRRPPNWFGWRFVNAPGSTLIPPGSSGLVVADGQNVVIGGSGFATITQAYSV
jgi:hypothetical protein